MYGVCRHQQCNPHDSIMPSYSTTLQQPTPSGSSSRPTLLTQPSGQLHVGALAVVVDGVCGVNHKRHLGRHHLLHQHRHARLALRHAAALRDMTALRVYSEAHTQATA